MAKPVKQAFMEALRGRFGHCSKVGSSLSLLSIGNDAARVLVRYSKTYGPTKAWYGVRHSDLRDLAGRPSFIAFLWDGQQEPLLLPYAEYEDVFQGAEPSPDGQYKVHIFMEPDSTALYIPRCGRFNVEGHFGWDALNRALDTSRLRPETNLTHPQVQTLLGSIGSSKGYDVWIPRNDVGKLDWSIAARFDPMDRLPSTVADISTVAEEVDVLWFERGANRLRALYEVEHTTSIYSGLLRFNDIHLALSKAAVPQYAIVADEVRRSVFSHQLSRPTFQASRLSELCSFLDYRNVDDWSRRAGVGRPQVGGTAGP